ncbi:metallophosphoesterase [Eubacterium ventriosum]|uniref:metallophosphoesterase n=1 Tax=Eubacterium ventriosum TaxID=39496 RepID=UPI002E79F1DA|nr:metallophosphoesterase [Eubacterium ventriosum]MEE0855444.1 metallophosphoesterase [Eubacterium ventriosum]
MEFTVNTGDMTQNGNRVNEWIDYYTGRQAMKDFEEMPVIGNNDLCPANIYQLGNGGDSSKINPKNLSFFYTFEMDEENPPIFNIEDKEVFIDSLYSFNYGNVHFMAINSEITDGTEKNVYGLSTNGLVYSNMKTWCQNDINKNSDKTWKIAFTHELPFTIITQNVISNFYWDNTENSKIERSGSHLNYNTTADNKYWFSKFCQENNIRLAIGGHKHTYAATFPLKENPASTMKPIIQVTAEMLQESFGTTTLAADNSDPQLEGQLFPSTWIGNDAYKT